MIIKDIRREFFDALKGRLLIMCTLDVDAVCCCKILQTLLESHNLQYSVAPVASSGKLWELFEEYRNSIDAVITINFGNLIDLPKLLKPPENLVFYVIDSHRPINVHNFYRNPQVRLYINADESELNIPAKSKLFLAENSNGQQSDADEVDEEQQLAALLEANASELSNEQLERRRELRQWLVARNQLLFDYEEFHFYNRSVALIMHELAHSLSKSNNYLLWLAIVGLTFQLRSHRISGDTFEHESERLLRHVARNEASRAQVRGNSWHISWQVDLQLDLYRKWSLYEALSNTPLTACRFQLWNQKGHRDLLGFLVDNGLKVIECKQVFACMSLDQKQQVMPAMQRVCLGDLENKYNLQELIARTFVMTSGLGRGTKFAASDYVLAVQAFLETHEPKMGPNEKFVRAINSLVYNKEFHLIDTGFEPAKHQLQAMFEQVRYLLTNQRLLDQGTFVFADLHEQPEVTLQFARGSSLVNFARFLLSAWVSSKTTRVARRAVRLPLVLFAHDATQPDQVLMVGVPPYAQQSKRNFFAKAFEQAAANADCELRPDLSETCLVRTSANNKNLILEQLKLLLD